MGVGARSSTVRRRAHAAAIGALLVLALLPSHVAVAATTLVYPSTQCNGTLQACIDLASPGDEVMIETNGLIDEQVVIQDKSMRLVGGTGYSPEVTSLKVTTSNAQTFPLDMRVSHIQVENALTVRLLGGPGTYVVVDHVSAQGSGASPGINGQVYVGSTITVSNSSVIQTGIYPGIDLESPSANNQDLVWNVIANSVSGKFASATVAGIKLSANRASTVLGGIYNNSIWDEGQGFTEGDHGGIVLFANASGPSKFDVVGNTVDKISGDGLVADNEQQSPNPFRINLFDNIFANTTGPAVDLVIQPDTSGPFVTAGGQNDQYKNGKPDHLLGHSIGTAMTVAPGFVNGPVGDLQLQPNSSLIDQGVTCSGGGVSGPDAAGRNRLHGTSVDVGAFEFGAGAPGKVLAGLNGPDNLIGGPGADILCGYGGKDNLYGGGGNDYLDGGSGNDQLHGGSGKDRLFARDGNDHLCATDLAPGDYLNGGTGTDSYRADSGDTKVSVEVNGGSC